MLRPLWDNPQQRYLRRLDRMGEAARQRGFFWELAWLVAHVVLLVVPWIVGVCLASMLTLVPTMLLAEATGLRPSTAFLAWHGGLFVVLMPIAYLIGVAIRYFQRQASQRPETP